MLVHIWHHHMLHRCMLRCVYDVMYNVRYRTFTISLDEHCLTSGMAVEQVILLPIESSRTKATAHKATSSQSLLSPSSTGPRDFCSPASAHSLQPSLPTSLSTLCRIYLVSIPLSRFDLSFSTRCIVRIPARSSVVAHNNPIERCPD